MVCCFPVFDLLHPFYIYIRYLASSSFPMVLISVYSASFSRLPNFCFWGTLYPSCLMFFLQLDSMIMSCNIPDNLVVVAKRSLLLMPGINFVLWLSDAILLDRSNREASIKSMAVAAEKVFYFSFSFSFLFPLKAYII